MYFFNLLNLTNGVFPIVSSIELKILDEVLDIKVYSLWNIFLIFLSLAILQISSTEISINFL